MADTECECNIGIPSQENYPIVGGLAEVQEATIETQEIIEKIKEIVLAKATQPIDDYQAISFKTQIAAFLIYFIKVRTGEDNFIHLRVHEIPNGENENFLELIEIQENKSKDEVLEYF